MQRICKIITAIGTTIQLILGILFFTIIILLIIVAFVALGYAFYHMFGIIGVIMYVCIAPICLFYEKIERMAKYGVWK